jgi:hypothetical protein
MVNCPKCGKEIADGASICKHCHAIIGVPQRPSGVTIIGILILFESLVSLLAAIMLVDFRFPLFLSLFSGGFITYSLAVLELERFSPLWLALVRIMAFSRSLVGIFSSVVLFKQKRNAINIYIGYAILSTINEFFWTSQYIFFGTDFVRFLLVFLIIATIIRVLVLGLILNYLRRNNKYFTN